MNIELKTNWSISSLQTYETCPLRFKFAKIDRIKEPPQPPDSPLERGNRVHNRLEKYVKAESDEMDTEARSIETFRPALDHLRVLYADGMATAEENWFYNRDWDVCSRDDVWLWSKLDFSVQDRDNAHVIVGDYKTGKSLYKAVDHVQQLQLYAAAAALRFDWADKITAELWYLDEGHVKPFEVNRDDALRFVGRFDQRANRMYSDRIFRANPNKITCAYCPYGPRRGNGHCPVGV